MIQCSRDSSSLGGGETADVIAAALFVRRRRYGRGEFLEARIIPERIEHGIEPEQRGSERAWYRK